VFSHFLSPPPPKSTSHIETKKGPGNHTDRRLLPKPGLKNLALHLPDKKKRSSFYLCFLLTCRLSSNILLFFLFALRISHIRISELYVSVGAYLSKLSFDSVTELSLISSETTNGLLLLREDWVRNGSARLYSLHVPNTKYEPARSG
jgi:hypothetical protein